MSKRSAPNFSLRSLFSFESSISRWYQSVLCLSILLLSCSSAPERQVSDNISFDLPPALTKAAADGELVARFIGTGSERKEVPLDISADGKVTGTMKVKPGKWVFAVQFYQIVKGAPVPVAFFQFTERDVTGERLDLSYKAEELKFDEPEAKEGVVSPSISPSPELMHPLCKDERKKYDCDNDGISNFEEIKAGSDPFDPKSKPEKLPPPPPPSPPLPAITVNLTEGQVVKDRITIRADGSSPNGIKSLLLVDPTGVADENSSPEVFISSIDTSVYPDDTDRSFTFEAEDLKGQKTKVVRKIRIDNVPNIRSFEKDLFIQSGSAATLSWEVENASGVKIVGVKDVPLKGTLSVSPTTTTTYHLEATRQIAGGKPFSSPTKEVTITVNHNPVFTPEKHLTKKLGEDPGAGINTAWEFTDSDGNAIETTTTVYKGKGCPGTPVSTVKGDAAKATLTGLDPRTDYSYIVSATDGKGGSATNACFDFTTGDKGLVGWWRFEEGSGTTAKDSSGKGNDGTLTNFDPDPAKVWVEGTKGKALKLDGTDDYVDLTADSRFDFSSGDFTVEGWIKTDGIAAAPPSRVLIAKHISGTPSGYFINVESEPGKIDFYAADGSFSSTSPVRITSGKRVDDMNWHHIVGIYQSSGKMVLYVDGLRENSNTAPRVGKNATSLRIGAVSTASSALSFFKGLIDEVAIYNRALNTAEVRASCRRNDPTGSTCASDDVPEQVNPGSNLTLPPTRAFLSWKEGPKTPAGKTFDHYDLCYAVAGEDLSSPLACLYPTSLKDSYFVMAHVQKSDGTVVPERMGKLLVNNKGYRWKVRTCYKPVPTSDCSDYSPVWSFATDNSVLGWWRFDDGAFVDESSPPAWFPIPSCDNDPVTGAFLEGVLCDSSGNNLFGTATGYTTSTEKDASRVAGTGLPGGDPSIVGNALSLNGKTHYVDLTSSVGTLRFSKADNYTMEARFRVTGGGHLISLTASGGAAPGTGLTVSSGGDVSFGVIDVRGDKVGHPAAFDTTLNKDYGVSSLNLKATSEESSGNVFHHAVGVYRGDSNLADDCSSTDCKVDPTPPQISLFVDGNLKGTKSGTIYPFGASDFAKAAFGKAGHTSADFFTGLIDEVAIHKTNLSAEVVKNNFCALEALAGTDLAKDPRTGVCR